MAPRESEYEHNRRWGDGNGFSHVRAALLVILEWWAYHRRLTV